MRSPPPPPPPENLPSLPVVKGQIGVSLPLILHRHLSHLFFPPAESMRRPPPPPANRPSLSVVKGLIQSWLIYTQVHQSLSLFLAFLCRVDDKSSKSPLPPRQRSNRPCLAHHIISHYLLFFSGRKSGDTSNRSWVADQLRCEDNYIKAISNICVSMVKRAYNLPADLPDDFSVDLTQYLITKVQTIEHDDHDQAALSLLKDGHCRVMFPLYRHLALFLLALCQVDGSLWPDILAYHHIQYITMKLRSSIKQPDADDASPSKKLKGS